MRTIILIIFSLISQSLFSQQDPTVEKQIIKFNFTKVLVSELTFSYESKIRKQPYEIELSYIYPILGDYAGIEGLRLPILCYNGGSIKLWLKWYKSNRFYYGLSLLYKYVYFNNKWVPIKHYLSGEYYYQNCSQSRNVSGLSVNFGFPKSGEKIIFEPYFSLGIKLINSNTKYNIYKIHYGGHDYYFEEKYPDFKLAGDNGLFILPCINLGCKIGFAWKLES